MSATETRPKTAGHVDRRDATPVLLHGAPRALDIIPTHYLLSRAAKANETAAELHAFLSA